MHSPYWTGKVSVLFVWTFEWSLVFEEQQGCQHSWRRVSEGRGEDVKSWQARPYRPYYCLGRNRGQSRAFRED